MTANRWQWILDSTQCTGCGICFDVCMSNAIIMTARMALPQSRDGACTGCNACAEQCPVDAVTVAETD